MDLRAEMGPSVGWNGLLICTQMAPEWTESDFALEGRIGTLGLKQIFLFFSVPLSHTSLKRCTPLTAVNARSFKYE